MSHTLRKVEKNIYARGVKGTLYFRKRVPTALKLAYPDQQTHYMCSLGTNDLQKARMKASIVERNFQAELDEARSRLDLCVSWKNPVPVKHLSESQLDGATRFWAHNILAADDEMRIQGLEDDEYDELLDRLQEQRKDFGRKLARGQGREFFATLHQFLNFCGIDYRPDEEETQRAGVLFLRTLVTVLDHQLARLNGHPVDTASVAPVVPHPLYLVAPDRAPASVQVATWDRVFECWKAFVVDRPMPTTTANLTAWSDLRRYAEAQGVDSPAAVTPKMMTDFVNYMAERLKVRTLNARLIKIRKIYATAMGMHVINVNPAQNTIGRSESCAKKRIKKRLPFSSDDLQTIFSSEVYLDHARSRGQAGEATYWLPLMMFYTGARPEEIAGLALSDLKHGPELGWYLDIVDRFSADDTNLFDDEADTDVVPDSHRRTLKSASSRRKIPVAQELLNLGLLRYVDWVKASGATVFFPTLRKDTQGKLSGAFSKFFGRHKRDLGIVDSRKVLYSFRHNMKDKLEEAGMPSKYLKRLLGHTSGEGAVTDGYGSDLPLNLIFDYFKIVRFTAIPARPWEPQRKLLSSR